VKLKEIVFAYQPNPNLWGSSEPQSPFTIAFCYLQTGEPFVVKGGWVDVEKYHRTLMQTYNLTEKIYFEEGKHRIAYKSKWKMYIQKDGQRIMLATVRRIPRKWMKELNPYVPVRRGERHKRLFRLENEQDRVLSKSS
jgi:hypothetical protein